MLKMPVAAFTASLKIVARIMRDSQQTFERGVDAVAEGVVQTLSNAPASVQMDEGRPAIPVGVAATDSATSTEGGSMADQDLSGDDLKVVRYRIIFTKRDYEGTLDEGEDTVNY